MKKNLNEYINIISFLYPLWILVWIIFIFWINSRLLNGGEYMAMDEIHLRGLTDYELLDAAATRMKQRHKRYGGWIKRLAELVKRVVNPPKGMWQPWWTIATRVFTFAYKGGHSEEVCVGVARVLAEEMGLDVGQAEELARAIKNNVSRIVGERTRAIIEEI